MTCRMFYLCCKFCRNILRLTSGSEQTTDLHARVIEFIYTDMFRIDFSEF